MEIHKVYEYDSHIHQTCPKRSWDEDGVGPVQIIFNASILTQKVDKTLNHKFKRQDFNYFKDF